MKNTLIAASILNGDFADMGRGVADLTEAGTDWIHLDVMDGVFVPNITFGPKTVADIKKCSDLFFDVHLMITEPKRYIENFAKAGADLISFHYEAESDIPGTIECIKNSGKKAAIAIKPDTDVKVLKPYIKDLALVLVMSVYPGFGGQKFIEETYRRLQQTAKMRDELSPDTLIEVDGGVNDKNASLITEAGADVLVVGNALMFAPDKKVMLKALRGCRNL